MNQTNQKATTQAVESIRIHMPLQLLYEGDITQVDPDKLGFGRNVMEDYPHQDGVRDKVEAIRISTETVEGKPMCVADCKLNGALTSDEYRKLVEFSSERMKETFAQQQPEPNMELGGMQFGG